MLPCLLNPAYLARRVLFYLKLARWKMRRSVSTRAWNAKVMALVWSSFERHTDTKKEENERLSMGVADTESRSSRQYMKLQIVLQAMETQKMAIGALVAMSGCVSLDFCVCNYILSIESTPFTCLMILCYLPSFTCSLCN
jgi:hypothetical protein